MRVVLDTNIWISFAMGKRLSSLQEHLLDHRLAIISCNQQLHEISGVLARPKFRKYFAIDDIVELIRLIMATAVMVDIDRILHVTPDSKDDYLIETAIAGSASMVITGDKALLAMRRYKNISIIAYTDFESLLEKRF